MAGEKVDSEFAELMRSALAAKEKAEGDLAEAVAASALGGSSDSDGSSSLDAARVAHQAAEERVAQLVEEASLYAARARDLSSALEREVSAHSSTQQELKAAGDALEAENAALVEAERRETELKARLEAAEERRREASEQEAAAVALAAKAARGHAISEERARAADAAANAAGAEVVSARDELERETDAARQSVAKAHEALAEMRRATELELGEVRRDADLHRQRRLAARTELLSIAKALEAARGDARSSEQAAREQLVPRLLQHSTRLAGLVERAVAIGREFGAREDTLLSSTRDRPADQSATQFPAKYLGELADEIQRIDSGINLLAQTFDVLEDALSQRSKHKLCGLYALHALCCSRRGPEPPRKRRLGFPASVTSPRGNKKKGGYRRVDDAPADDDDDDTVL